MAATIPLNRLNPARSNPLLRSAPLLRRAARFAAVGALGTLVDASLFALLHLALGLAALPANVVSYGAGIINNYALHRRWTFAAGARQPALPQFARFAAVSLSALALNTLAIALLDPALGALLPGALAALAAKACATVVGMGWNFVINHVWTFRA